MVYFTMNKYKNNSAFIYDLLCIFELFHLINHEGHTMTITELIHALNSRDDTLCRAAAAELTNLTKKYKELGRSYDAMSADLIKLLNENRILRNADDKK